MNRTNSSNVQANFTTGLSSPQTAVIGLLLVIALFAFELFNFDTTRYALQNLLGDVNFNGIRWATILAIAFCAIDFAGLARLLTPEQDQGSQTAVWYLMGAWLLGATMNALMTWWAVSLTLLSHDFGNEVVSREQLLQVVPIFVATLVWLTRILFIGAFSMIGEQLFISDKKQERNQTATHPTIQMPKPASPGLKLVRDTKTAVSQPARRTPSKPEQQRIRHRPPVPRSASQAPAGMYARERRR